MTERTYIEELARPIRVGLIFYTKATGCHCWGHRNRQLSSRAQSTLRRNKNFNGRERANIIASFVFLHRLPECCIAY